MTKKEFGEACVHDFGVPYTKEIGLLNRLKARAELIAEVYYDWGNGIGYLKKCIWPIMNGVVYANAGMITDAGMEVDISKAPKESLVSPVLDFRDMASFYHDEWVSEYHDELERKVYNAVTGFGAADQVGEEYIVRFPIWYDMWLQAVIGWGNAGAIIDEFTGHEKAG